MILRIFIFFALTVFGHYCKTVQTPKRNLRDRMLSETIERDPSWDTLRFYVDWSQITNFDKQEYEKYIDAAFVYFSNALKVHQITSNSTWDEFFTENIYCEKLYERYEGRLIKNTDMLVVITTEYNTNETYLAYSTTCAKDPKTNQPIATLINLNTANIYINDDTAGEFIGLMTHELAHSLGFSYDSIYDFIKVNDTTYSEKELFTIVFTRDLVDQKFLITPKVQELARKAFDCRNLPGIQLENQDEDTGMHWDKRIMGIEYMNPDILNSDLVYSDITLAVFEDSGWYEVDYSYGKQINFGYKKGCKFINEKCIVDEKPIFDEFCVGEVENLCDASHLSYGNCFLDIIEDGIPYEFQYFSNETLGGDYYSDYCPVNSRNTICRSESYEPESDLGESFGLGCRCVEGNFSLNGTDVYRGSCHEINCFDNSFNVTIGNTTVNCTKEGEELAVEGFKGYLKCPSFDKVCADVSCRNNCYGGKCVHGKCTNNGDLDGFGGEDYPDYGRITPGPYENLTYGDLSDYVYSSRASALYCCLAYLILGN